MSVALFDGNHLLHRTCHVPHLRVLSTKDKKPTGAMFGMIKSIRSTLATWPDIRRVVVIFDGGHSRRRKELFAGYKNRVKNETIDPDGLSYIKKFYMQVNYLKFVLPKLGIKVVRLPGREADDIIGLLARQLDDNLKIVVSDDRDMMQMIDSDVHVWRPIAEQRVTLQNFEEYAKCCKEHWLLRKAILGDSSDTIPGVKGVGEKTIDKLLEEVDIGDYPHEDFFAYTLDHPSKKVRSIGENFDNVIRNCKLIDVELEKFTPEDVSSILDTVSARSKFDVLAVRKAFLSFEFYSLVEDFARWVTPFQMLN